MVNAPDGRPHSKTRSYDASGRRAAAARNRARIVDAAADLFSAQGYARTTLDQIARHAEVTVKLVVANGPKRDLMLAAFEQRFAGVEDPGVDGARVSAAAILADADAATVTRRLADYVVSGQQRGIGIWTAFASAAREDSDVAVVYAQVAKGRYAATRAGLEMLAERDMLRPGPIDQHVATLALLMGFDPYQLAVLDWGWSPDQHRAWIEATISATIVQDPPTVKTRVHRT